MKGKLILQDTWTFKCGKGEPLSWDDRLPPEIEHRWLKWIREIKECSKFQVGRYIFKNLNYVPTTNALELHAYSDAGDLCWGAAIYIRFYNPKTGNFEVHLIYSCSRVAPTKSKLSIPRKELNAIVLGCEKLLYISKFLKIDVSHTYAHSDSLVSLHWIKKDMNKLSVYISNRVQKIQNSGVRIFFVPGVLNPGDLVSKPKPSRDYVNNSFWLHGPKLSKVTEPLVDARIQFGLYN